MSTHHVLYEVLTSELFIISPVEVGKKGNGLELLF